MLATADLHVVPSWAEGGGDSSVPLYTASRPFSGLVRRSMAEQAACLAAAISAYDRSVEALAGDRDVAFAGKGGVQGGMRPAALDGLARMLYTVELAASEVDGFPPYLEARLSVRLEVPANKREILQKGLRHPELLAIYAQIQASQRVLLKRYDDLASMLLSVRPGTPGAEERVGSLLDILSESKALDTYALLLAEHDAVWRDPLAAKNALAGLAGQAPHNPLIQAALAEAYLQLDRPAAALEHAGAALAAMPDFARAHDIKGAALLRQQLPVLAVESFSQAIALEPGTASYYLHRAAAYLVLEEKDYVCADFRYLCSIGDCNGYAWAQSLGMCGGEEE